MLGEQPNPFEELFNEAESVVNTEFGFEPSTLFSNIRIDMTEEDDKYTVTADLPGYRKDEIEITVHQNILTIETSAEEQEESDSDYYIRERQQKEKRTIKLPSTVTNPDDIEAEYKNGVLYIEIPKNGEEHTGVEIDVE